ncbi:DUF202 domain-containing protein [Arthrobacter sp. B1805]|uniref:DUF202 domain-containing protein n=1 Tax=Arthrobacter sp. B1805 TaxID=2058892 RepID=UPI000CE4A153|nr:DUF202 domain-containing protein [Arthrobacter sp. B1805]
MSESHPLYDAGLQPERTALAWRRTALSVGLGALVAARLLPVLLGHPVWAAIGIAGVMGSAAVWWTSHCRYTAFYRHQRPHPSSVQGAWPVAVLASSTFLIGIGALALSVALLI